MSEMWNAVAGGWERNALMVEEHLGAATDALLDAAGVRPGSRVLDIAAGAGGAGLAAAARVGDSGRVTLADVAPAMVEAAARRAASLPNVDTLTCDALDIEAPDGSYDAVITRHGLMFAEPPQAAVREAVRVLAPGGRYAAMTWSAREENPWLGLLFDAFGDQFGVPFPPPGVSGPFALADAGILAGALREGGLEDVQVRRLDTPMRLPSLAVWWERIPELAGPLAIAMDGMEPEVRAAIGQRAVEAAGTVAEERADGVELAGGVLIASGRTGREPGLSSVVKSGHGA